MRLKRRAARRTCRGHLAWTWLLASLYVSLSLSMCVCVSLSASLSLSLSLSLSRLSVSIFLSLSFPSQHTSQNLSGLASLTKNNSRLFMLGVSWRADCYRGIPRCRDRRRVQARARQLTPPSPTPFTLPRAPFRCRDRRRVQARARQAGRGETGSAGGCRGTAVETTEAVQ